MTYFEYIDDAQAEKLAGGITIPPGGGNSLDPTPKAILSGYLAAFVGNGLPAWVGQSDKAGIFLQFKSIIQTFVAAKNTAG